MRATGARLLSCAAIMAGAAVFADTPPPGATSCTGCHGAGSGPLSLDALSAEDIEQALAEFRSGARDATLMNRIARGFTVEQSAAIARWLEAQ